MPESLPESFILRRAVLLSRSTPHPPAPRRPQASSRSHPLGAPTSPWCWWRCWCRRWRAWAWFGSTGERGGAWPPASCTQPGDCSLPLQPVPASLETNSGKQQVLCYHPRLRPNTSAPPCRLSIRVLEQIARDETGGALTVADRFSLAFTHGLGHGAVHSFFLFVR